MKDPKTSIIAGVVGCMIVALLIALLIKKIDLPTFGAAAGTVGGMGATVLGYFSADSKTPPAA